MIEAERASFERAIKSGQIPTDEAAEAPVGAQAGVLEGAKDQLDVWLRYIKWVRERFPSGGSKSQLLPILERCTRSLLQEVVTNEEGARECIYADDVRYLRVWIAYADNLEEPLEVRTHARLVVTRGSVHYNRPCPTISYPAPAVPRHANEAATALPPGLPVP